MSTHHQVFLSPRHPRRRLLDDISAACGARLEPVDSEFIEYSTQQMSVRRTSRGR